MPISLANVKNAGKDRIWFPKSVTLPELSGKFNMRSKTRIFLSLTSCSGLTMIRGSTEIYTMCSVDAKSSAIAKKKIFSKYPKIMIKKV